MAAVEFCSADVCLSWVGCTLSSVHSGASLGFGMRQAHSVMRVVAGGAADRIFKGCRCPAGKTLVWLLVFSLLQPAQD